MKDIYLAIGVVIFGVILAIGVMYEALIHPDRGIRLAAGIMSVATIGAMVLVWKTVRHGADDVE